MHVLTLVPKFPNLVQTYIVSTLVGLKTLGIKTTIVAKVGDKSSSLPPAIINNKLLLDTIYIYTEGFSLFKSFLGLPFYKIKYLRSVKRLFKSNILHDFGLKYFIKSLIHVKILTYEKIDIIHSHSFVTSYEYLFLKEVFSIPIVATFHGHIPQGVKPMSNKKIGAIMSKVDIYFVNTPFSKQQLLELGCLGEIIKIIPQGTDLNYFPYHERFISPDKAIRILTVGRLSIEKGHATAIRAIALLADKFPMIEYHIAGSGPERENLTSLVLDLQMQDKIFFHGFVTSEDLKNLYATAHIFILPSIDLHDGFHVETQGVVLQEAQACGLAAIASRTGGIPYIIKDNETGLLFDEGDASNLAEKIKTLIENPAIYSKTCLLGRQDVETRFDINVICNKLVASYSDCISHTSKHI